MATYSHTVITPSDDVTVEYTIGFSYARTDDVKVYIDGVEIDRGTDADQWVYSSAGAKITFTSPNHPTSSQTLTIKRVTDISDSTTVYSAGTGFSHTDANAFINQLLYAIDELQVPAFDSGWQSVATLVDGEVDIEYLHGLEAVPTRILIQYKCTDTELGYETGDVITAAEALIGGVFPVSTTAFTATFETITDLRFFNVTTGVATTADDAKWSYRILAWR
jgi:hypothetical protein